MRVPIALAAVRSAAGFAPDLDRDLVDAQGDRGLGLGGLDPHALQLVVGEQAVGDRAAEALERLVRALLGDQRDELADLGVVDRVGDRVGDGRVGLADIQAQVEHEALADLSLGLADAVVGVERQAADLDRYRLGCLLAVAPVVELVCVVPALLGVHSSPKLAAATASASRTAATSWTRKMRAPRS
jgi:hypothetical protein